MNRGLQLEFPTSCATTSAAISYILGLAVHLDLSIILFVCLSVAMFAALLYSAVFANSTLLVHAILRPTLYRPLPPDLVGFGYSPLPSVDLNIVCLYLHLHPLRF